MIPTTNPSAESGDAQEFYANLLGLNVCGEKPGEFVQFAVGDAAVCMDLADGEEPPAAIFAVRGLEQLGRCLADAGCQWCDPRRRARGLRGCA
jgi:hypothetical protein